MKVNRPAPRAVENPDSKGPGIWGGAVHREGDLYILSDAGVSIRRPDASWEFEPVVQGAPLLARMWDSERKSEVTMQVHCTMGMDFEALVPMVEANLTGRVRYFPFRFR